jgi:hypothetical protein
MKKKGSKKEEKKTASESKHEEKDHSRIYKFNDEWITPGHVNFKWWVSKFRKVKTIIIVKFVMNL